METPKEQPITSEDLAAHLPTPPQEWDRTRQNGGAVQYRLAGEDGVCALAKLTVRPDHLGKAAIRIDRTGGCRHAGTSKHDDIEEVVQTVTSELAAATPSS